MAAVQQRSLWTRSGRVVFVDVLQFYSSSPRVGRERKKNVFLQQKKKNNNNTFFSHRSERYADRGSEKQFHAFWEPPPSQTRLGEVNDFSKQYYFKRSIACAKHDIKFSPTIRLKVPGPKSVILIEGNSESKPGLVGPVSDFNAPNRCWNQSQNDTRKFFRNFSGPRDNAESRIDDEV